MPYRLIVDGLCPNVFVNSSDSFGISIRDRVLIFEVHAFQILRLLTEYLTHCLVVLFTDTDRPGASTAPRR